METKKFLLLLIVVFGVLLGRLFQLTVLEGSRYHQLSEGQRIRERKIRAPRGLIKDRNGKILARNKPVYKKSKGLSAGRQGKSQKAKGGEEYEIISHQEALRIKAQGGPEAASLKVEVAREYVWGKVLAHVIGYTGEVTKEEVQSSKFKVQSYQFGERIGRMGVEEEYDEILRGVNGKELIETNAQGEPLRLLGKIEPWPGRDLVLAIDLSLQKRAAELLEGKKGAVVASNPQNGEILALYSAPSFDPNLFVEGGEEVSKVLKDPLRPLFNRAIAGLYPPGSVFKLITAAAGLEEGVIDKKTKIEDVGVIQVGPYRFSNWFFTQYGKKEGMVDVVKAIKRSNDIFFYKVGEKLGIKRLVKWAEKFGVGSRLGIDLPGEGKGLMPDPSWKKRVKGERWFLGDTYHLAIGQGNLLTTPLQVNFWTAVFANGGRLCRPKIKGFEARGFGFKEDCQEVGLSEETIALVKEGMRQACQPGGTGWPLFGFKVQSSKFKVDGKNFLDAGGGWVEIPTGCKTGTAEFGDPKGRTHAWFTVFAPFEDPQIVVTVLVEGGGEGSSVAAPIAKEILKEWFKR